MEVSNIKRKWYVCKHTFFLCCFGFVLFIYPFVQLTFNKDARYSWSPYTDVILYQVEYYDVIDGSWVMDTSDDYLYGDMLGQFGYRDGSVRLSGYGIGALRQSIQNYVDYVATCNDSSGVRSQKIAHVKWRDSRDVLYSEYIYSSLQKQKIWRKFCQK